MQYIRIYDIIIVVWFLNKYYMSDKSEKAFSNRSEIAWWEEKMKRKSKAKKYFFYPILIELVIFFTVGFLVSSFTYFGVLIVGKILEIGLFVILFSWIYTVFILCNKDTKSVRITLFSLVSVISTISIAFSFYGPTITNPSSWLDAVNESGHSNSIQYPEKVWKFVLTYVKEKNVKSGTRRGLPNGKFVNMEEWVNIYYAPENKLEYPFANIHIEKSSSGTFEQDKSNLTDLIVWENEGSKKKWISSMIEYSTWIILSQYPYQEITMKEGSSGVKSHVIIFDKDRNTSITIYFLNQWDVNNIYKDNTEFHEYKKQFLEEFLWFFKK